MKRYLSLIFFLMLAAINFNFILKPLKLVTGGTAGIAIVLTSILNIKPYIIILIINISMLIISYLKLNKSVTYSAILASFIYPFFVKITNIGFVININMFINSLIAGVISGITGGYIYKLNFSSGGITIINILINKYLKIKISKINFIINSIIIIIGGILFGINKIIYSLIVVIVGSLIINNIFDKNNQSCDII